VRLVQGCLSLLGEYHRAVHRFGKPAALRRGDHVSGDDPQRGAVRVVAAEDLFGVIVGDVADPAPVGQCLLDLAGLAQPADIRGPAHFHAVALQPGCEGRPVEAAVEPLDHQGVGVHRAAQEQRRR
jgi:hypothetical protein